ncbi:hypothetical protein KKF55_01705 [Patescibacteria group bacterium]|nr:hypothetical protein [Patescibacteria group bacterium]
MKNKPFKQTEINDFPKERVVEKIVYVERENDKPVLVELTPKKYKRWMVRGMNFAVLGFILGIACSVVSVIYDQGVLAFLFLIMGFILFVIGTWIKKTAEYMAWWNNG